MLFLVVTFKLLIRSNWLNLVIYLELDQVMSA